MAHVGLVSLRRSSPWWLREEELPRTPCGAERGGAGPRRMGKPHDDEALGPGKV